MAYFSSIGPTEDDRIKPDIVAPGRTLLSAGARKNKVGECDGNQRPKVGDTINNNIGLSFSQGTSMAAPVVSGTAALVRQYFQEGYYPSGKPNADDALTPTGSLMKAVLLNGGQPLIGIDNVSSTKPSSPYDSAQGFGRVSLIDSLPLSGSNSLQAKIIDRASIENDETNTLTVKIDKENGCTITDLSATLVWTDPPAAAGCQSCLLNDLDLSIDRVGGGNAKTYYPNGHGSKDDLNNVERIRFEVKDGESFDVTVYGENLSTSSQRYSLVVTGCLASEVNTSSAPTPSPTQTPTDPGTNSIETTYDSDDHEAGVMFDVTAMHTVTIESIDIHVSMTSKEDIEIFTKTGSHEGYESSKKRWNKMGTVEVTGRGKNQHTQIPKFGFSPIRINENNVQAFYITLCDSDSLLYTKGNGVGNIFVSNFDLAIHEGTGVAFRFGTITKKRVFNGVLNYVVEGEGSDDSVETDMLETTFDQNLKFESVGNMFNIEASESTAVQIISFDIHLDSSDTESVRVYTREGGYEGYESMRIEWRKIADVDVKAQGLKTPTPIPQFDFTPVVISAGQTQAFYVISRDIVYTKVPQSDAGTVATTNSDLQIFVGAATRKTFNRARGRSLWDGVVHYLPVS